MKIRNGFVSNSSSSSFVINCVWYGGLVAASAMTAYMVFNRKKFIESVREGFRRILTRYLKIGM